MANYIIKLEENKYVEWSTITDSPVSNIMSESEAYDYVKELELKADPIDDDDDQELKSLKTKLWYEKIKKRWDRVLSTGTSAMDGTNAKDIEDGNRAGERENKLSVQEIIEAYTCVPEKKGKFPFR